MAKLTINFELDNITEVKMGKICDNLYIDPKNEDGTPKTGAELQEEITELTRNLLFSKYIQGKRRNAKRNLPDDDIFTK